MMTKRVFEHAITIAPERVLEWDLDSRSGTDGMFEHRVNVLDIEVDGDR